MLDCQQIAASFIDGRFEFSESYGLSAVVSEADVLKFLGRCGFESDVVNKNVSILKNGNSPYIFENGKFWKDYFFAGVNAEPLSKEEIERYNELEKLGLVTTPQLDYLETVIVCATSYEYRKSARLILGHIIGKELPHEKHEINRE